MSEAKEAETIGVGVDGCQEIQLRPDLRSAAEPYPLAKCKNLYMIFLNLHAFPGEFMVPDLKVRLLNTLPKGLILDLLDMVIARALAAYEMVRDHAGLDEKRARELVGQARFRMMEKGFSETCERYGGRSLPNDVIPGSDLRVFQPFMRFEGESGGVLLGLATMPEKRALPQKNQSRSAGVTLNYELVPHLDLDGSGPKVSDVFVCFLVARDPLRAGKIEEVAIGLIDSGYTSFVFYESIEDFLSGYATPPAAASPPTDPAPLVKLKPQAKPFVPPEKTDRKEKEEPDDGVA